MNYIHRWGIQEFRSRSPPSSWGGTKQVILRHGSNKIQAPLATLHHRHAWVEDSCIQKPGVNFKTETYLWLRVRSFFFWIQKSHMMTLYYSLFYPYIDYGITLWGASYTQPINKLQTSQKKAIRLITGSKYNDHTDPLFRSTKILKIKDIYEYKMAKFMYLFNANILPNPISEMLTMNTEIHDHFTRNRKNPHIQYRRTQIASKTLRHQGPIFWYKIPSEIKAKQTVKSFGYCLKRNIVETYPILWIILLLILDCDFAFFFDKIRKLFHLNYFSRGLKCLWCPSCKIFGSFKIFMYFLIYLLNY